MNIIIGIGEMNISSNKEDTLITYALGSCIGISMYDPQAGVGGLIHCMLPLSKIDPEKAKIEPYKFTDVGVTLFLQEILNRGAKKTNLIVKVAGCSNILDEKKLFNIGERNYTIARKILWKNDILIASEDIGGVKSRTMRLSMSSGSTYLKMNGVEVEM